MRVFGRFGGDRRRVGEVVVARRALHFEAEEAGAAVLAVDRDLVFDARLRLEFELLRFAERSAAEIEPLARGDRSPKFAPLASCLRTLVPGWYESADAGIP